MEKVKVEFKTPENKIIEYNGVAIEVIPHLSLATMSFLIGNYLADLFNNLEEGNIAIACIIAESNSFNYICQLNTNIDTKQFDEDLYVDDSFRKMIFEAIDNYWSYRDFLAEAIRFKKEEIRLEKSVGSVIDNLAEKALDILNKFSEIKPEEIKELQQKGLELADKLEKSSILSDSQKAPRKTRARKA